MMEPGAWPASELHYSLAFPSCHRREGALLIRGLVWGPHPPTTWRIPELRSAPLTPCCSCILIPICTKGIYGFHNLI